MHLCQWLVVHKRRLDGIVFVIPARTCHPEFYRVFGNAYYTLDNMSRFIVVGVLLIAALVYSVQAFPQRGLIPEISTMPIPTSSQAPPNLGEKMENVIGGGIGSVVNKISNTFREQTQALLSNPAVREYLNDSATILNTTLNVIRGEINSIISELTKL